MGEGLQPVQLIVAERNGSGRKNLGEAIVDCRGDPVACGAQRRRGVEMTGNLGDNAEAPVLLDAIKGNASDGTPLRSSA